MKERGGSLPWLGAPRRRSGGEVVSAANALFEQLTRVLREDEVSSRVEGASSRSAAEASLFSEALTSAERARLVLEQEAPVRARAFSFSLYIGISG